MDLLVDQPTYAHLAGLSLAYVQQYVRLYMFMFVQRVCVWGGGELKYKRKRVDSMYYYLVAT